MYEYIDIKHLAYKTNTLEFARQVKVIKTTWICV